LRIKERDIGIDQLPFIVAEIGINHGGSLEIAKKMVFEASKVGAEYIKHQTHFVEDEMTVEAKNIFSPNGAIYVFSVKDFMQEKGFPKKNIGFYEMPPEISVDIDNMADLIEVNKLINF
tara:strand:+ start:138 stop:494 length:357 start_codon:yes stop_codon:yes gene_type:complete